MADVIKAILNSPAPIILIVAGILFILLGTGALRIRYAKFEYSTHPHQQRLMVIFGCLLLIIGIVLPFIPTSKVTPGSQATETITQTPIPTQGAVTSTPTSTRTATPTNAPTPQTTTTELASNQTITKNETLTCSSCSNDPIHFTIDSITVDNSNGRTLWNITLTNVSANDYKVYDDNISLEASPLNQPVPATGYWSDGLFNEVYINAGQKANDQLIFTSPVYTGVVYTLSAQLSTGYNGGIVMTFDDASFTF